MKYNLENLLILFQNHEKEFLKTRESLIKKYKEDYPKSSLPSTLTDEFNLPAAFQVIIKEIRDLKNEKRIHN